MNDFADCDQIPNTTGGMEYSFENNNLELLPNFSIGKYTPGTIRITAYNVLHDGWMDGLMGCLIQTRSPIIHDY